MSVDELSVELLSAGLSPDDPLKAFIGSIHSRRGDLGRRRTARSVTSSESSTATHPRGARRLAALAT